MKTIFRTLLLTLSAGFLFSSLVLAQDGNLSGYTRQDFSLPANTETLLLVDANGNGLKDLLAVDGKQLSLYFHQTDSGFNFSSPSAVLELPGEANGWDLSDKYFNAQGETRMAVIALIDGTHVMAWPIGASGFSEPVQVIGNLTGFLGQGTYRLNFSRDINNDGLDDLVIPGSGELQIHIRNADGSYQNSISVLSDMQISTNLSAGEDLESDVGQALRIPLMQLRDVNGDGLPDLISETTERFDVFLAKGSSNAYFSLLPDISIDRLEIRERLGSFDLDQLDFSNLTGILALTHEEILQDVNGDSIDDFVLREGGKVSLFLGRRDGMDFSQPQQVLRSSGNVLTTFLYDENEDGLDDLWLWRVEPISVGDIFVWLALSGSISVEAFVYRNEGQRFASRPARKVTVALRFPSAVRMISSVLDVRDRARSVSDEVVPVALASVNGMSDQHDLLVLLQDQVQVFMDAIPKEPDAEDDRFLASLNYSRTRDNYEIDIRRFIDEFTIEQNRELTQVQGRTPAATVPLNAPMRNGDILTSDLNGNGLDDIFVFLVRDREELTGFLLLSDQR